MKKPNEKKILDIIKKVNDMSYDETPEVKNYLSRIKENAMDLIAFNMGYINKEEIRKIGVHKTVYKTENGKELSSEKLWEIISDKICK